MNEWNGRGIQTATFGLLLLLLLYFNSTTDADAQQLIAVLLSRCVCVWFAVSNQQPTQDDNHRLLTAPTILYNEWACF